MASNESKGHKKYTESSCQAASSDDTELMMVLSKHRETFEAVALVSAAIGIGMRKVNDEFDILRQVVKARSALLLLEESTERIADILGYLSENPITSAVQVILVLNQHQIEDSISHYPVVIELIRSPFEIIELQFRINSVLRSQSCYAAYDELLNQKMKELQDFQSVMIESFATLAEYRDPDTGEHITRTQNYVKALAIDLRRHGHYLEELSDEAIELMYLSVPLHDIGKIGVPDDILLKPSRLTQEEFEVMKRHAELGHDALLRTREKIRDNAFLKYADDVAYTHQEKWDGTGYPRGLMGSEIPLVGRLMAVADVYDALISARVYKPAMTHAEAMTYIQEQSGTHFDPVVSASAVRLAETFKNIAHTYEDTAKADAGRGALANWVSEGFLKSVLVVDDSRLIRSILNNQFENIGLSCTTAGDGREALALATQQHYDLILTDIDMPIMDGYSFAKALRAQLELPPPIIGMTASDFETKLEEIKSKGLDGLLLKPVDFKRLALSLHRIFLARG